MTKSGELAGITHRLRTSLHRLTFDARRSRVATKPDLLRVQDVRDAYRLIGECRDLGHEPALWHRQMMKGLCRLLGTPAATAGEGRWTWPTVPVEPIVSFDMRFDPRGHQAFMRLVTRARCPLLVDVEWYQSVSFNELQRPGRIDHQLTSIYQVSKAGAVSIITMSRALGDRNFSRREHQLLRFFHGEIGRLIGRSLVSALEPTSDMLSPRLRQTLACLVEGDSEKQVAVRLGLSHATIHQYVTSLYRLFGVTSRAQLLARVMRRVGRQAAGLRPTTRAGARSSSPGS